MQSRISICGASGLLGTQTKRAKDPRVLLWALIVTLLVRLPMRQPEARSKLSAELRPMVVPDTLETVE